MNTENTLWEELADDWDKRVGDDGNDFHRELIRPATLRLLDPKPGECILDIACGNGVFSRYLASLGAHVVAFDYSPGMIEYAKKRCANFTERIELFVADATDYNQIMSLGAGKPINKAVANMALMGIPDIAPLLKAIFDLLPSGGVFVFSTTHPCFQTPNKSFTPDGKGVIISEYIEPQQYSYQILADNPKSAYHWHRPLQELLGLCFHAGFVVDGLEEPVHEKTKHTHSVWDKVPLPIVVRLRKIEK